MLCAYPALGVLLGQSQDLASVSLKDINPLMEVLMSACKLVTQRNTWVVHLAFRLTKASEKGGDCKAKWRDLSQHLPSTDYCLAFHQTSFMQAGTSSGSVPTVSLVSGTGTSQSTFVFLFFICHVCFHLFHIYLHVLHKVLHACHFLLFKCQRKNRVSSYLW